MGAIFVQDDDMVDYTPGADTVAVALGAYCDTIVS